MGYKVVESVVVSLLVLLQLLKILLNNPNSNPHFHSLAAITANFEFSCPTSYLDHQAGMLALPV